MVKKNPSHIAKGIYTIYPACSAHATEQKHHLKNKD